MRVLTLRKVDALSWHRVSFPENLDQPIDRALANAASIVASITLYNSVIAAFSFINAASRHLKQGADFEVRITLSLQEANFSLQLSHSSLLIKKENAVKKSWFVIYM